MRSLDDRLVDAAAALVARLAVRHGVGKYAFLVQILVGALVMLGVFVVVLLIPADRRDEAAYVAGFAALTGIGAAGLLVRCVRLERRSGDRDAARDDAVRSAVWRHEERGTRYAEAAVCGFLLFLGVLATFRGYPVFVLVFGSNLLLLTAEYVRCVPMVPPKRRTAASGAPDAAGAKA